MKRFFKILLVIALVIAFSGFIGFCVTKIPVNHESYEMMLCADKILSGDFFAYAGVSDGLSLPVIEMLFYVIGVAIFGVGANAFHVSVALMQLFLLLSAVLTALYGVKRRWTAVSLMAAAGGIPLVYALSHAYAHADIFAFAFLAVLFAHVYNETLRKHAVIILGLIIALAVCCDWVSVLFIVLPLIILSCFGAFEKSFTVALVSILGLCVGIVAQRLYFLDFNMPLPISSVAVTEILGGLKGCAKAALLRFEGLSSFGKALSGANAIFFALKIIILAFAVYIVYCAVKEVFRKRETDIPVAGLGLGLVWVLVLLLFTKFDAGVTIKQFSPLVPLVLSVCLARCTGLFGALNKRKTTAFVIIFCVLIAAINLCQLLYGILNL